MKIAFLVTDLGLSGGMNVILHHAMALSNYHGHQVALITLAGTEATWGHDKLGHVTVVSLEEARGIHFDVLIATFWSTLLSMSSVNATNHVWFCQSLEDRFYPASDDTRGLAEAALQLDLPIITEATWIKETLNQIAPKRSVYLVHNGIDKNIFTPKGRSNDEDGPLRVLIEGTYSSVTKGIPFALNGVLSSSSDYVLRHITRDSRYLPKHKKYTPVFGELTFSEMADAYRWCDVLVKTSDVEGMFGPPLEAFHCGATAIVTPVTGYDEYVVGGKNALVVPWEDERTLSKMIDSLATNQRLLSDLKDAALETAKSWPDWDEAGAKFNSAILRIVSQGEGTIAHSADFYDLSQYVRRDRTKAITHSERRLPGVGLAKRILNARIDYWFRWVIRDPKSAFFRVNQIVKSYFLN